MGIDFGTSNTTVVLARSAGRLRPAGYFIGAHRCTAGAGASAVVYDFGVGTFDASVVRRTRAGFEMLAVEGLADAGGKDIDAAVVAGHGGSLAARDETLWRRLTVPGTPAERRRWLTGAEHYQLAKKPKPPRNGRARTANPPAPGVAYVYRRVAASRRTCPFAHQATEPPRCFGDSHGGDSSRSLGFRPTSGLPMNASGV